MPLPTKGLIGIQCLTDHSSQGVGMIVNTTVPEIDSTVWAEYSPHRVRTSGLPDAQIVSIIPSAVTVNEPQLPEPLAIEPLTVDAETGDALPRAAASSDACLSPAQGLRLTA
jgi:hypothetical protein